MLTEKSKSWAEMDEEEADLGSDDQELYDFEKLNSAKAKKLREKGLLELARQNNKRTQLLNEAEDALNSAFQLLKDESNQRTHKARQILSRLQSLQSSWRDEILSELSKIQIIENELEPPEEKMVLVKVIGQEGTLPSKLAHEYYGDYINTLKACHSFFLNLHNAIIVCQNTISSSCIPYYDIETNSAAKLFGVEFNEEPVFKCIFHMLKMQFLINGKQNILFTHFYDMNYRLHLLQSLRSDFLNIEVFKALENGKHENLHNHFPTNAHKALLIAYSSQNAFLPPTSSVTLVNKSLNDDFTSLRRFYDLLTAINMKIADCNTVLGTTSHLSFTDTSPEAISKFFGITITDIDAQYVTAELIQLSKKQKVEKITKINRRLFNMEQQCDALLLTLNSEAHMDLPSIPEPHNMFSEKLNDFKKRCSHITIKARL